MGTTAGQPPAGQPSRVAAFGHTAGSGEPAPGQEGAGGRGTSEPGQPGQGGAPAGDENQFNRDQLNPILRGMKPEQINELFTAMLTKMGAGNGPPAPREEPVAEPELPAMDYKAALDPSNDGFNPEAAFDHFVKKNYGTLMRDMNSRSVKGLYGNFRNQIHDFNDYEQDIDTALSKRDPATLSEKDIFGTYLAIKGMRALTKERSERAAAAGKSVRPPSAAQEPDPQGEELDATATEMARLMFPNEADPIAKYKAMQKKSNLGAYELKVPIGDGKTA